MLYGLHRMQPAPRHERPYGMDAPCEAGPQEVRRGVVHLAVAGGVVIALSLASYLFPGLDRVRPWLPGEGPPIARLFFDDDAEAPSTAIATGGAVSSPEASTPDEDPLAALVEEPEITEPPPVVDAQHGVRVEPSELEGLVREIEDPSGRAMRAFYDSLRRTASRDGGHVTRIAHFGDSTIALDGITMTVRQRMQQRFGDAGHGFVLAARGSLPYRHHDVRHESEGRWSIYEITRLPLADGRYGLGGVQSRASSGATAWFSSDEDGTVGRSVSRFTIFYQRHPRGGHVQYRVDDGEWLVLDTEGTQPEDAIHPIEVPDGHHRLSLRAAGHGESRLYGVTLDREGPGVSYDSLGFVGARASRMLGFTPQTLGAQLGFRDTSLVIIAFGGNDADDDRDQADFERTFREVARLVRTARPEASCLLFAPLDQAERDSRGAVRTLPSVPLIVNAMRAAAAAEGCAFFDTWTAMGGEGSMGRWFRRQPRLSSGDFRHATPAGYRVVGTMLYQALLAGFAHDLESRR